MCKSANAVPMHEIVAFSVSTQNQEKTLLSNQS